MKSSVKHLEVRFSAHATEDLEKVKKAVINLFPGMNLEELSLRSCSLRGHYGNPITVFRTILKEKNVIDAFVNNLSQNLSRSDKQEIIDHLPALMDRNDFYIRLDKQAAYKGELRVRSDDSIKVRMRLAQRNDEEIHNLLGLTL